LGLLIIDEEHRFGVRHKEAMKALRAEVDVLTLTATPIPRTLGMALEGLRDLSVIATAPQRRLAIKTFVRNEGTGVIREAVLRTCEKFDAAYWLEKDRHGGFPLDFHAAIAEAGWLGICMPPEYGGAGLGIQEAALLVQAISESGAGLSGVSAIHMNIFGLNPVVKFGTDAQKQRMLPPLIAGTDKACFGVTEPGAGLNTTRLTTKAVRDGDDYIVSGQKVWISTAQVANKILLLARTTPIEETKNPIDGLTLFYADIDRNTFEARQIDKMGRKAVDSNQVFIDGMRVPAADRIGEEGKGFRYILDGLNPERILVAAEAVGLGRVALQSAAKYAGERIVFDRPIGQNQAIQHPLAQRWIELEAAALLTYRAASLYDAGKPCGAEANAAKYFAGEAGVKASETAVLTHGGMGYAKEFHVERYFREAMIPRIAPVSSQLILCHIAERVLGLPKSY
jgi:acyl-CoA dehydrogenase